MLFFSEHWKLHFQQKNQICDETSSPKPQAILDDSSFLKRNSSQSWEHLLTEWERKTENSSSVTVDVEASIIDPFEI